jgi:hypothetical protein
MLDTRRKPLLILVMGWVIGLALTSCTAQPASPPAPPTRAPQSSPPPTRAPLPTTPPTRAPLPTVVSPISPLPRPMKPSAPPTSLPGSRAVQPGADPVALQETNAAIDDLSKRTGIPKSDIKVVSVEAVQWPDASVGCPQPDRMYAQVVTPGYLIILEAGGQTYEYHSAGAGVGLCQPQKP